MSELTDRLANELEKLRTKRDELRVQIDLGKKDLEDVWQEAESKWSSLESHLGRLKREGDDALGEIEEAADLLVDEIKDGFKRIRKML